MTLEVVSRTAAAPPEQSSSTSSLGENCWLQQPIRLVFLFLSGSSLFKVLCSQGDWENNFKRSKKGFTLLISWQTLSILVVYFGVEQLTENQGRKGCWKASVPWTLAQGSEAQLSSCFLSCFFPERSSRDRDLRGVWWVQSWKGVMEHLPQSRASARCSLRNSDCALTKCLLE